MPNGGFYLADACMPLLASHQVEGPDYSGLSAGFQFALAQRLREVFGFFYPASASASASVSPQSGRARAACPLFLFPIFFLCAYNVLCDVGLSFCDSVAPRLAFSPTRHHHPPHQVAAAALSEEGDFFDFEYNGRFRFRVPKHECGRAMEGLFYPKVFLAPSGKFVFVLWACAVGVDEVGVCVSRPLVRPSTERLTPDPFHHHPPTTTIIRQRQSTTTPLCRA